MQDLHFKKMIHNNTHRRNNMPLQTNAFYLDVNICKASLLSAQTSVQRAGSSNSSTNSNV